MSTKDKSPCPVISDLLGDLEDGKRVHVKCPEENMSQMAVRKGNRIDIYDTSGFFKKKISSVWGVGK